MANLTALQCIDYTQAKVGKLDNQYLDKGLMLIDLSLTQREVQNDLMALLGMKVFTKQATISGTAGLFTLPTDLRTEPNSIIDVKAGVSSGAKAVWHLDYTNPTAHIILTAVNPGTAPNTWGIYDSDPGSLDINLVISKTGVYTITIGFDSANNTCAEIISALNAHPVLGTLMVATTSTPTIKPVTAGVGYTIYTSGTDATTYYPIKTELDITDYNRLVNDSYRCPTVTQPTFT